MPLEPFGAIARWLRESKGFKQARAVTEGARAFRGTLPCRGQSVGIRIEIKDWDFVAYPKIFLVSVPDNLKGIRPHIGSDGDLCYFAKREILLNRYRPLEAVARCLQQAQEVLDRMASTDRISIETQDEFGMYWGQLPVLIGSIETREKQARLVFVDCGDRTFYWLTQGSNEVEWLRKSLSAKTTPDNTIPTWLVSSSEYPAVDHTGLPTTIKQTLMWLKRWDIDCYRSVEKILEKRDYLDHAAACFMFNSPIGWFGFILPLDPTRCKVYKRKPVRYRQYLFAKGADTKINRIFGLDASPEFVHQRNINGPSLLGKKVTIIGCGAIGGYLANALVRLGAGTGKEGRMNLIDPDVVQAGNLGRHSLGFDALLRPKAEALKADLLRQFPYLNIECQSTDAREVKNLFSADFIVDATGEEALSIGINEIHQIRLRATARTPPVLYVWVAGNGEAVQALHVDGNKSGCYRCLRIDRVNETMKDRFPLLKNPPKTKYLGCQSVTPFAVSSAMSAAALGSDIIIDWLGGNPAPRFRTRTREHAEVFKLKNQDIGKLENCPSCQRI